MSNNIEYNNTKIRNNFIIYTKVIIFFTTINTYFLIRYYLSSNSSTDNLAPLVISLWPIIIMIYIICPIYLISIIYNIIKRRFTIFPPYFIISIICIIISIIEFIIIP